jgi:hypothetical protein
MRSSEMHALRRKANFRRPFGACHHQVRFSEPQQRLQRVDEGAHAVLLVCIFGNVVYRISVTGSLVRAGQAVQPVRLAG